MPLTIVLGPPAHAEALRAAGLDPARTLQVDVEGARVERHRGGVTAWSADGGRLDGDALVLAGDLRAALPALTDATTHEKKLLGAIDAQGEFPGVDPTWTYSRQLACIAGERRTWHIPGDASRTELRAVVNGVRKLRTGVGDAVGGPRVAVLGGGPAGLATAHLLEQQGVRATVFEVADRLGGKCQSIRVGQVWHDLGGCFTTPDYHVFRDWQRHRGMGHTGVSDRKFLTPGGAFTTMYSTLTAERGFANISVATLSYLRHWYRRQAALTRMTSLPEERRAALVEECATPANAWFEANGLHAIVPVFEFVMTALGYDWFDQVPMLYVHRWVGPEKVLAIAAEGMLTQELREGFQLFWEAMAHPLWDVRLGANVTSVERSPAGVVVHSDRGSEAFAAVVVACPLPTVPFAARTHHEDTFVERSRTVDYVSFLARIRGLPEGTYTIRDRLRPEATGKVYCIRTTSHDKLRDPSDAELFIGYAYANGVITDEEIQAGLGPDLQGYGCELIELVAFQRWSFFPHFPGDAVRDGLPWEVDAAQGDHRTWYVGPLASFESNDNVIDLASRLVPRIVDAVR